MGKKIGKILIGTSGWHYAHWKGPFYPRKLSDRKLLSFYTAHFDTVEMNRTFYSLPLKRVFEDYAKHVPHHFLFSIKASRFITHIKRLKDPKPSLLRLMRRIQGLHSHLGPILFQLPRGFKVDMERLETFLKNMPTGFRYTFEFRDESWLCEKVYALLKKYKSSFCIYEIDHFLTPKIITANFIYIRLHGPKGAYTGKYSLKTLKTWAEFIRKQANEGRDVYCYFDNDQAGYAPKNALELRRLLKEQAPECR